MKVFMGTLFGSRSGSTGNCAKGNQRERCGEKSRLVTVCNQLAAFHFDPVELTMVQSPNQKLGNLSVIVLLRPVEGIPATSFDMPEVGSVFD